jgi:hypothetical protein
MALAKETVLQLGRIPTGKGIFGKDTAAVVRNPFDFFIHLFLHVGVEGRMQIMPSGLACRRIDRGCQHGVAAKTIDFRLISVTRVVLVLVVVLVVVVVVFLFLDCQTCAILHRAL